MGRIGHRLGSFADMRRRLAGCRPQRIAVVSAQEAEVLLALQAASGLGIILPVLVGDQAATAALLKQLGLDFRCELVAAGSHQEAASLAVGMVARGAADGLMKGCIPSADFLKAVLARDHGLRTDRPLSHLTAMESPMHGRFIFVTDAAVNIAPDLQRKRQILENAVAAVQALGIDEPVAAAICAVETVNPAMPATVDARALQDMNRAGTIQGVRLLGPVSLDIAISAEAAATKGFDDPAAGHADILLVPDIETGNVLVKSLHYFAGLEHGGIVLGAAAPIVLVSRADSVQGKLNSLLLAALLAERNSHG